MTAAPAPLPGEPTAPGEGRLRVLCRVCGKPLRDPVARRWGLGRECWGKLDLRAARARGRWDVEQDTLPGV
ncbi:DUF6011 domain-containing protein [Streptomyces radiopugnans]|nr:DUF6011 domain-containing protein [Streptomyces radiopugnans]